MTDTLNVIVFYGGEAATEPREALLDWLNDSQTVRRVGKSIQARKVVDAAPHSGDSVDQRVEQAIAWADKAIMLFTPDDRSEYGAPNLLEEFGRWRSSKGGQTMAVIRHQTVSVHSNAAGLVYIGYQDDVVAECREQLLTFLKEERSDDDWTARFYKGVLSLKRLRDHDILRVTGFLGIWLVGLWRVKPFFEWPFASQADFLQACIWFGAAALALPAGMTLTHAFNDRQANRLPTFADRWQLWVLRATASYLVYHMVFGIMFIGASLLYGAGLWPPPTWGWGVLWFMGLLAMFALTRQFTLRHVDEHGKPYRHDGDERFLAIVGLAGPLFAVLFYINLYQALTRPMTQSVLTLLAVTICVALIRWQNHRRIATGEK